MRLGITALGLESAGWCFGRLPALNTPFHEFAKPPTEFDTWLLDIALDKVGYHQARQAKKDC